MDDLDRLRGVLGGTYRVEKELTGGGMAKVFLAEETALGRQVVIKLLPQALAADVSAERFRREIRLAAQLQHPHIVPVLQSGDADGFLYYTMPFVQGDSVRSLIARDGPLPVAHAVRILRDVLDALNAAHGRGIVHRDVKPDNILVSGQHALVTDFGIAKALAASAPSVTTTATGLALGTPAYMAPEQVTADDAIDHRADIYAVGVLAYELLAGRPPFVGPSAQAVLAAHVAQAPEPISRRRPDLPAPLSALVMRCLEKHPSDRPQSAAEVLAALDAIPVSTGAAVPPQRLRRPVLLGLGVVVVLAGLAVPFAARNPGGAPGAVTSIAVLPFENVGGDSTDEYFADGMTDEITAAVGNIPTLQVASRSSAFTFKRRKVDVGQVGRELNVASVLDGSVQRAGGRIRVRAQLTKVSDNFALWSGSYEGDAKSVFELQDTIARSIAEALRVRLGASQSALAERGTADLEAYDLYLKGRYAWNQRTGRSLQQAARYFEDAIARDAAFARAHAGIAESYVLMPFYATTRPLDAWTRAKAAAIRALAIDSTLAEARATLAYGTFLYEGDFARAEAGFRRAIDDDPRYATSYQWFADMLGGQGRIDDRLAQLRRAQNLDPLSRIFGHEIAQTLFVLNRLGEATAQLEQTLALDPAFAPASRTLGLLYFRQHRPEEGIRLLKQSLELSDRRPIDVGHLAWVMAKAGRRDSAQALLRELESRSKTEHISSFALAIANVGLENKDAAFRLLDRGLDAREPSLIENWFDPALNELHSDPRWQLFRQRLGLKH